MTGSRNAQGIIEKEAIWYVERREAGSGASRGLYWVDAQVIEELRPKKEL